MGINPIKIIGNWDEGFALDRHVLVSTPNGENVYGHTEFVTVRTELGELVFQFKYRGRYECLEGIMNCIKNFLDSWEVLKEVDIILPVPSSTQRNYQPSVEISTEISKYLKKNISYRVLEKVNKQQSKNMDRTDKDLTNCFIAKYKAKKPHTVLLVDDLYCTGESFKQCVLALKEDPNLRKVYVLAMTKTKG